MPTTLTLSRQKQLQQQHALQRHRRQRPMKRICGAALRPSQQQWHRPTDASQRHACARCPLPASERTGRSGRSLMFSTLPQLRPQGSRWEACSRVSGQ
jgi:hypothetical protein